MKVQSMRHLEIEQDPQQRTTLQLQRAFSKLLSELRGTRGDLDLSAYPDALTASLRQNVEAMHVELAELLDHLPWKNWKDYPSDSFTEEVLEEVKFEAIDLLHFLNNCFIALGMTDEDVRAYYWAKHKENVQRQYGKYSRTKRDLPEEYQ